MVGVSLGASMLGMALALTLHMYMRAPRRAGLIKRSMIPRVGLTANLWWRGNGKNVEWRDVL